MSFGTEYYLYIVKSDGWEDLLWYTESEKEVTEQEAMQRYNECNADLHVRLYKITRPLNNKTMIADNRGN